MYLYRAGDIMIPLDKYPHIPYWYTLRQALVALERTELTMDNVKSLARVVLVFDEEYRLLGLVRRRDILSGLEPDYLRRYLPPATGANERIEVSEQLLQSIQKNIEKQVSDVMVRLYQAVDINDTIIDVSHTIVEKNVSLVPVTKDGEVVGVVRTVEILHEVAKIVE